MKFVEFERRFNMYFNVLFRFLYRLSTVLKQFADKN